jgi:serine/threonine-protein phosphatase PP1 catalytic subunit
MCLLFALKILEPEAIYLLRGAFENASESEKLGFKQDCRQRYGSNAAWFQFTNAFEWMPCAAIVDDRLFAVHGGPCVGLVNCTQIEQIKRPVDVSPS